MMIKIGARAYKIIYVICGIPWSEFKKFSGPPVTMFLIVYSHMPIRKPSPPDNMRRAESGFHDNFTLFAGAFDRLVTRERMSLYYHY